ncbi:acetylxylan esterase [Bacillus massilinigeriensis]|uniref:acetylxylan esterase n=1 Tax=Bacillus massilionigeriensis TaxID=1805475 RepID=UPI00096B10F5|nr:alpha/beta fold hydrolase [Bacillus massilionigeriensis]
MLRQIADFSLEDLHSYKPTLTAREDFVDFWQTMSSQVPPQIDAEVNWLSYPIEQVKVADVTIKSWDHTPLRAWLISPNQLNKETPALLHFHGYTDSRGQVEQYLKWALQGITVISFEIRGQGFSPDYAKYPNGTQIQGWMTLGIEEKGSYYYANVYKDVMACVNWAFELDGIDRTRVGVFGESQGGALALVAAAMNQEIQMVMADYPFLSHFERALKIASGPYTEILYYFKYRDPEGKRYEKVLENLSYFDMMNFAPLVKCPSLLCIGLEDSVTPPSTVFSVYNLLGSTNKDIKVYPEHSHELISWHEEEKIKFVCKYFLSN